MLQNHSIGMCLRLLKTNQLFGRAASHGVYYQNLPATANLQNKSYWSENYVGRYYMGSAPLGSTNLYEAFCSGLSLS
jgi:hypothetical protein